MPSEIAVLYFKHTYVHWQNVMSVHYILVTQMDALTEIWKDADLILLTMVVL